MTPRTTVLNEWFPVAALADVQPGSCNAFELLDERFVILAGADGAASVFVDTCPHRGAQLTLGEFDGEHLHCPYHGWQFRIDGSCATQPAHPNRTPPTAAHLHSIASCEAYGLLWVALGDEPRHVPSFPAFDEPGGVNIVLPPTAVESSGPRIVENFLDMAHFPFVHRGYLGETPQTEVGRYQVVSTDDELQLTGCSFWQPKPWPSATEGGMVNYGYSVSHPYAAVLSKLPSEDEEDGERSGFSILLIASPITETRCLVWRVVAVRDPDVDVDAQRAFNQTIFSQDLDIVESQQPKCLPLDPRAELHQPSDAGSLGYRSWLTARGTEYGVIPHDRHP